MLAMPSRQRTILRQRRFFKSAILAPLVVWSGATIARGQEPTWENVTPAPPPRALATASFDGAHGQIVLFGGRFGYSSIIRYGDTRGWNGASWTRIAETGPSSREASASAYDSNRGTILLFGGRGESEHLGDTWEWDGFSWTELPVAGPTPRRSHSMAYDSNRQRVVLFGGADYSGALGDTWEWDGVVWSQVSTTGPTSRNAHAMAYDSVRQRVVLFGGTDFTVSFGDTWEWDGIEWTQVAVTGPSARRFHGMAYHAGSDKVVLFGGASSTGYMGDTWEWDGSAWTQRLGPGPTPPRYEHIMAYDSARDRIIAFGGYTYQHGMAFFLADTWEWDGGSWTLRGTSGPSRRDSHAMAYDSARSRVVLFGGTDGGASLNDTWEWNGTNWNQRSTSGPTPRYGHAMAFDSGRGRTVMFGGFNSNSVTYSAETWEWDGTSWIFRASTGPSKRSWHSLVYDSRRSRVVLFGGQYFPSTGGVVRLGDTWEWDGTSWIQLATTGPPAGGSIAMAYDSDRGRTVLYGGIIGSTLVGQTWEWDGTSWAENSTIGPPPRGGHAMAYDSYRQRTVLFGGYYTGIPSAETWEWDGMTWTQHDVSSPPTLFGNVMAYDSGHAQVVLFGGTFGGHPQPDTWEYGLPGGCGWCGDLDLNRNVDGFDFSTFLSAFGSYETEPAYLSCADYDDDGVISLVDYQAWLQCYRAFVGDPSARAPVPADLGDLNEDGRVDGLDLQPFVEVLLNPNTADFRERFCSDADGSGTIDLQDVPGFVGMLQQ